jgi:hypothetical protein
MDNARINPATGRQFVMDQVPASAFFNAANVASRDYPFLPGTAAGSLGRKHVPSARAEKLRNRIRKEYEVGKDRGHELQFRAEVYNTFNRVQSEFDLDRHQSRRIPGSTPISARSPD